MTIWLVLFIGYIIGAITGYEKGWNAGTMDARRWAETIKRARASK